MSLPTENTHRIMNVFENMTLRIIEIIGQKVKEQKSV